MTERYRAEIDALTDWFAQRLPALGILAISDAEYLRGVDSLSGRHAELRDEAFGIWLDGRNYELSCNQMCQAFFAAARRCDVLRIG